MSRTGRVAAVALVLAACNGGASDIDDPFADVPDLRGRYNLILDGAAGCENRFELLQWVEGLLEISGEPLSTTFTIGGRPLLGSVDSSSSFHFGGSVPRGGLDLGVFGDGVAVQSGGKWVLDGDIGAEVDENGDGEGDCTISGPFRANQVSE